MKKLLGMALVFGLLILVQPFVARAGDDGTSFFPDNKPNAKCETSVAKDVGKLIACYIGCHVKAANKSFAKKGTCNNGSCFDEEGCETKCDTVYTTKVGKLEAQGICPSCLNVTSVGQLATSLIEGNNGSTFCEGTVPFAP